MKPKLLLSDPSTVSAKEPNNPWMTGEKFNLSVAWSQWEHLYEELAKEATLYLLPAEGEYQDRTYVSNVGAILTSRIALVSNFTSRPRQGEEIMARKFLSALGYKVHQPRRKWEGEADLKRIKDNLFFAGWGIRSEAMAYVWMEKEFGIKTIPILMDDPKLYHLDCVLFPLPNSKILTHPNILPNAMNPILIPEQYRYDSWTNSLILGKKWFFYTDGGVKSRAALERIIQVEGYEPVFIDLSEFEKSGAGLSCFVMHL
jgi:arginine dihydrolase